MTDTIDATKAASLFKAYDVRGLAPVELTPELAYRVGRALVAEFKLDAVAVGRDADVAEVAWGFEDDCPLRDLEPVSSVDAPDDGEAIAGQKIGVADVFEQFSSARPE